MSVKEYEKNSKNFSIEKFLKARDKTISVVKKVASLVEVGMDELDGLELIENVLSEFGCEKKWHPSKFRIGSNTTKSFKELSDPDIILKKNDIYFIDIGPVFNGHEGDYGETFTLGSSEEYLNTLNICKKVFRETSDYFKKLKISGKDLYEFAQSRCENYGHILNLKMSGHRLGDFPHAIHHQGSLLNLSSVPSENFWVLEILIKKANSNYGAFYEDLI